MEPIWEIDEGGGGDIDDSTAPPSECDNDIGEGAARVIAFSGFQMATQTGLMAESAIANVAPVWFNFRMTSFMVDLNLFSHKRFITIALQRLKVQV